MSHTRLTMRNEYVLLALLVLALAGFGAIDARFLALGNLISIAQQSAIIAVIAFAMTMVIIARGIDISVGSTLAFAAIAAGLVYSATSSALLSAIAAITAGAAIGALNGAMIGIAGISPFIATLATMALARGLALSLSGSSSIMIDSPALLFLGSANIGPVPASVMLAALLCIGWWFLLTRTVFGRWVYALGGNAPAAKATGIPVKRVEFIVYVLAGASAGLGAIIAIGRLGSAQPLAGTGLEFVAITAAIIGGTRLSGGEGSVWGTVSGAILIGVINTGLSFMQVPQIIIYFVTAALILIAVLISQPESVTHLFRKRRAAPASTAEAGGGRETIELRDLGKIFPGIKALDGVSFTMRAGEIVAVAGENGAGKSTLVKCLSGIYTPDEGEILVGGVPFRPASSSEATHISVIHQHFSLAPDLTVTENMFLGREPRLMGVLIDRRRMRRESVRVLAELGLEIDPDRVLGTLTVGEQQMVEIARAVLSDAWMFIMDEPTSALSNRERDRLYKIIDQLRERGVGILYISHKMEEIFSQCSRVIVLRDGSFVGERAVSETDEAEIISMMVGREVDNVFPYHKAQTGEIAVAVEGLSDGGLLKSATLKVRRGEIVALAGLMGSGRSEVLRCIAGMTEPSAGKIDLPTSDQSAGGVVYIPEDRHLEGFVGPMTIRDNTTLAWIGNHSPGGILDQSGIAQVAQEQIDALGIRPPQPLKKVAELSGGNQQKVVIGKWLATGPRVVLLDEPTRGVDVGAKSELHALIARLKDQGVAILMVSSELPEVLGVADRIVVMREGRTVGELPHGASEEDVMSLAFGQTGQVA